MTTSAIKYVALFLMLLDHVHQFFPNTPEWLTYFGCSSAVLFLFCAAEACYHSRGKDFYLFRLFAASIGMNLLTLFLTALFPAAVIPITNNIFETIFLSVLLMRLYVFFRIGVEKRDPVYITAVVVFFVIFHIFGIIWQEFIFSFHLGKRFLLPLVRMFPCIEHTEGGVVFVLLGLFFFIFRGFRFGQIILLIVCAMILIAAGYTREVFMVAAGVPIVLYCGERGGASKHLFYWVYPVHIGVMYILAAVL